ncbi:MAG: ATP-binding protein [Deltaproteobacteria bacterium]|jgi:predicted AAA+ superfamily ATPase|nr:ATP-binding protein [Deltaproteobacteria bacterium]
MLNILKSIILDFQETKLDTGTPRRLALETVRGKAAVCVGVRRCGKTTLMLQRVQRLLDSGVPRQNILHLNFVDDRLHNLAAGNIGLVSEAYYSLYPEKKNAEEVYFFLDEIQVVPGWESFAERLLRTEKCQVFLTGSSSTMLSREIASQMRGRALTWELFPFSFGEFLDSRGIASKGYASNKKRLIIQKAFGEYWEDGGFPEVNGQSPRIRIMIHQEYLQAVLFRDLVQRHDVSHPRALTDLAHWLFENMASLYSVNKLAGYLKSLGHRIPKASVSDYLEWFEDAFFFFTVRLFDPSLARANANPKKIYSVDHALAASVSAGILPNSGHRLENIVFMALRRACPSVRYYRTGAGREVDFIVPGPGRSWRLIQACETLANPHTRERETRAMGEAMAELGLKAGTIVTRLESELIETGQGTIEVVPAWRFLLELEEQASSPSPPGPSAE